MLVCSPARVVDFGLAVLVFCRSTPFSIFAILASCFCSVSRLHIVRCPSIIPLQRRTQLATAAYPRLNPCLGLRHPSRIASIPVYHMHLHPVVFTLSLSRLIARTLCVCTNSCVFLLQPSPRSPLALLRPCVVRSRSAFVSAHCPAHMAHPIVLHLVVFTSLYLFCTKSLPQLSVALVATTRTLPPVLLSPSLLSSPVLPLSALSVSASSFGSRSSFSLFRVLALVPFRRVVFIHPLAVVHLRISCDPHAECASSFAYDFTWPRQLCGVRTCYVRAFKERRHSYG